MIKAMYLPLLIGLLQFSNVAAQDKSFNITPEISITPLSPNAYMHTCDNSNGLIFVNEDKAVLISTPPNDIACLDLINWIQDNLQKKIVACIIDRWHPDAMEGLDVIHNNGIPSYSYKLTKKIAIQKGLPVPQNSFEEKQDLTIGNLNLTCHYFGPAHTTDGIVVYIPSEKILFGGNEVRSFNGWIGNIADADLNQWSSTIRKVKAAYGQAEIVIPGHGPFGGPELLDYTIDLYTPSAWGEILKLHNIKPKRVFNEKKLYFEIASRDTLLKGKRILVDAIVFIDKGEQYIMIESPIIQTNSQGSFRSDYGRIRILNKKDSGNLDETDGYYKRLFVDLRDDEVGLTIVMQELIR